MAQSKTAGQLLLVHVILRTLHVYMYTYVHTYFVQVCIHIQCQVNRLMHRPSHRNLLLLNGSGTRTRKGGVLGMEYASRIWSKVQYRLRSAQCTTTSLLCVVNAVNCVSGDWPPGVSVRVQSDTGKKTQKRRSCLPDRPGSACAYMTSHMCFAVLYTQLPTHGSARITVLLCEEMEVQDLCQFIA